MKVTVKLFFPLALLLSLSFFFQCSSPQACTPGGTQECSCSAETKGVQVCIASGLAWGTCECSNNNSNTNANDNTNTNTNTSPPQQTFCDLDASLVAGTYTLRIEEVQGGNRVDEIILVIDKSGQVTADGSNTTETEDLRCNSNMTKLCDLTLRCKSSFSQREATITFNRKGESPVARANFCAMSAEDLAGEMTWRQTVAGSNESAEIAFTIQKDGTTLAALRVPNSPQRGTLSCKMVKSNLCDLIMICEDLESESRRQYKITFKKQ